MSEEARKWILEHPEEAKKAFLDFYEWFGKISYEMQKYVSQLGIAILELFEKALQYDETGELKKKLEEAGFYVTPWGKIVTMPKIPKKAIEHGVEP